jgi:hypothetical protein
LSEGREVPEKLFGKERKKKLEKIYNSKLKVSLEE